MLRRLATVAVAFAGLVAAAARADDPAITKHDRWTTAVAFGPGNLLVTVGGESLQYRPGDVKLWDLATGNLVASLEGHTSNVWSAALTPDGKRLITSGYDGKILIHDTAEKKEIAKLEKHKGWCRSVAAAPDGKHFASAGEDGSVVIWDLDGPKEVKTFKAHESAVYQLAFSPDGKTLATASTDKTAKLWSWQEAEPKETAKLQGHEDAVWSVVYSRDGQRLATSGADRTVRLWDATGKLVATLRGHRDWVSGVAFSADGRFLASSSHDRTVKLWDLEAVARLAPETDAAAKMLADSKTAVEQSVDEAAAAQAEADKQKAKADAIATSILNRQLADKLKQVQEGSDKFKDNEFLKKAFDEVKAGADKAAADDTAKSKALEADKEFTEKLTKLKAGPIEEAQKEKDAIQKLVDEGAAKVKAAEDKKAAAEKAITDAKQRLEQLSEQQAKTLGGSKSTVWGIAFSPDGKTIASGSHKDSIQIWEVATVATQRFAPKVVDPAKPAEGQTAAAEEKK